VKNIIAIVRIIFLVGLLSSLAFAQERTALTLHQISELLNGRVSSTRIVRLVEQQGVGFELNEAAIRRLRADGADEAVLAAVRKMALRYTEEQRRKRLEDAGRQKSVEEGKREENTGQRVEEIRRQLQENARRIEEQKRSVEQKQPGTGAEKGSRESARTVDEAEGKTKPITLQKPLKETKAALMSQEDVGRVASLRNMTSAEKGEVSGAVVNNSNATLRDVQLQIVYSWRWKNEFQPGKDDPGTARYFTLNQEIPPGQTASFDYKPSPPLASRSDGQFDITVKVVGFAQVFQPAAR
jgi:hypothetical protein